MTELETLLEYTKQIEATKMPAADSLAYLEYNCAMPLKDKIEGCDVYFITTDISSDSFQVREVPSETDPETINDKLHQMKRLQMFKRISHRAGLAEYNTLKNINLNHKKTVSTIYRAIRSCFPEIDEDEIVTHI